MVKLRRFGLSCIKSAPLSKLKLLHSCGLFRLQLASYVAMSFFEGDSKICFVPLISRDLPSDWSTSNIICNIIIIFKSCLCFSFRWVKQLCNSMAYTATKLAIRSNMSVYFSNNNLPKKVVSACMVDHPPVSLV